MIVLNGNSASCGIAMGKISFLKKDEINIRKIHITDIKEEIKKFEKAKQKAIDELKLLYEKALKEVGETNASVFEIHQMMIEDEDYNDSVINMIKSQKINADFAIASTSENFSQVFSNMDDEYMKARAIDVKDISERIIKCLANKKSFEEINDEKVIICAEDLAPSETVQLDKSKVLAFVTKNGSINSHTAILARTMNIPAIINVGEKLDESVNGEFAVVDGFSGKFYIDPDEATIKKLKEKESEEKKAKNLLEQLKGKDNVTVDGTKIEVFANIGSLSDLGAVMLNDAGGIGLFRSEFLYLENNSLPSEEEQLLCYKKVLENMAEKKVIIRTMDIGADKQADYLNLKKEENPALGYRAIRICLTQKEIFKTQLRALLRASVYGNLSVMFPMIISEWEVVEIKNLIEETKNELKNENYPYKENLEIGIMIETPAAALISDALAKYVDFFSIGTNDLTQYTLALDRQNQKIEQFYNPHHSAVMKLIELTVKNAHNNGVWVGICGELASDTDLTEKFLKMGIDELSVSPPYVLKLRDKIRKIKLF